MSKLSAEERVYLEEYQEIPIVAAFSDELCDHEIKDCLPALLDLIGYDYSLISEGRLFQEKFWRYIDTGITRKILSKAQKDEYIRLRAAAQKLSDLLLEAQSDDDLALSFSNMSYSSQDGDFEDMPFLKKASVRKLLENLTIFQSECGDVISDKASQRILNEFVYEVACSYTVLSGKEFTSSNSNNEISSQGENFVLNACKIVEWLNFSRRRWAIYHLEGKSIEVNYTEADVEFKPVPDSLVKNACKAARLRIRSCG